MPYALRRLSLADAPSIHALMSACNVAVIGRPDVTLDDVLAEMREPGLDLGRDAWIATGAEDAALGCAFALRQSGSDLVELDIYVHPEAEAGFDSQLWQLVEMRAAEIGRELGHPQVHLDVGFYRADARHRQTAAARGFTATTAYHRMRIDFDGPVSSPEPPPDVRIEAAADDERLRHAAVDIDNTSFIEHHGFVEHSYEWWVEKVEASATSGWALTRILSVGGVPAALLQASTQFVEDENCGYVGVLGVLEEFRGRGFGRLLLLDAFAQDAALGRVGTILHVDVNNVTPALGLYESVGMRQVLVIDNWRRTVDL